MTLTLTTERMAEIAKLAIRLQQISGCAAVTSSGETIMHHTFVDTILSALHDVTAELLANREAQPVAGECNKEVYENGQSVCLVDIPKETAEVICRGISQATGCKVDWHYIGGRVHIKALAPPAPAVVNGRTAEGWMAEALLQKKIADDLRKSEPAMPEEAKVGEMPFLGNSEPGYVRGWNDCRAAMMQNCASGEPSIDAGLMANKRENCASVNQPVSSGYTLPDGWIACTEQTPDADGAYWCWFGKEEPSVIQQRVCIWISRHNEWCDSAVTHWMPLPAAPEGGNG